MIKRLNFYSRRDVIYIAIWLNYFSLLIGQFQLYISSLSPFLQTFSFSQSLNTEIFAWQDLAKALNCSNVEERLNLFLRIKCKVLLWRHSLLPVLHACILKALAETK